VLLSFRFAQSQHQCLHEPSFDFLIGPLGRQTLGLGDLSIGFGNLAIGLLLRATK